MQISTGIRRFFAAHREALRSYDALNELDEFLAAPVDYPLVIGADFDTVDTAIEHINSLRTGVEVSSAMFAATARRAQLFSSVAQMLGSEVAILEDGIAEILAEAAEVKSPNGTTRKLVRVANETLAKLEAFRNGEDEAAEEASDEAAPETESVFSNAKPAQPSIFASHHGTVAPTPIVGTDPNTIAPQPFVLPLTDDAPSTGQFGGFAGGGDSFDGAGASGSFTFEAPTSAPAPSYESTPSTPSYDSTPSYSDSGSSSFGGE